MRRIIEKILQAPLYPNDLYPNELVWPEKKVKEIKDAIRQMKNEETPTSRDEEKLGAISPLSCSRS